MKLHEPFQLFTPEQCKQIILDAVGQSSGTRSLVIGKLEVATRTSTTFWYTVDDAQVYLKYFEPFKDQGYEVTWVQRPLQVARYEPGQQFDWHKDQAKGKRSTGRLLTLTCTLQKAPNALFETKERSYDLNVGEAVIFPAKDLHRATAPSSGERWAITIWGSGKINKKNKRK